MGIENEKVATERAQRTDRCNYTSSALRDVQSREELRTAETCEIITRGGLRNYLLSHTVSLRVHDGEAWERTNCLAAGALPQGLVFSQAIQRR